MRCCYAYYYVQLSVYDSVYLTYIMNVFFCGEPNKYLITERMNFAELSANLNSLV